MHYLSTTGLAFLVLSVSILTEIQAQGIFDPPQPKMEIRAEQVDTPIKLDGILDEAAWSKAQGVCHFIQSEPRQRESASLDTEVKILYDDKNLYIGAYCEEPLGKEGVYIQDLRRDFSYTQNELFGVLFDPFQDVRNPVPTFMVTPYASLRELQIFDDRVFDLDWNAVWTARTSITDSSWVMEMAIPWTSLRYPKDSTIWGVNFNRNIRRKNEITGWSPWPRAYTVGRMAYAGLLTGLKPPPPSLNLRLQPYTLYQVRDNIEGSVHSGLPKARFGGEAKWAITPYMVAELTINTDFAQAEVDRQVINLTRFSFFFPEKRQFFLENSNLFSLGENGLIQPFFSRRIGLDDTGNQIPLNFGLRVINQNSRQAMGGMVINEKSGPFKPASVYGISRYTRNFGTNTRVGGMIVTKFQKPSEQADGRTNIVGVLDGFTRIGQRMFIRGMVSNMIDDEQEEMEFAGFWEFNYEQNQMEVNLQQAIISDNYVPATGFISRSDLLVNGSRLNTFLQPSWLPAYIRSLNPGLDIQLFHRLSDLEFQEAMATLKPVFINFQNRSSVGINIIPNWQYLSNQFSPIKGISLPEGHYQYWRYEIAGETNQSAPYSISFKMSTGGFFNGKLNSALAGVRIAPIPYIAIAVSYNWNEFKGQGNGSFTRTHLVTPEVRLALNPRVQLTALYQYNSENRTGGVNLRFSWEYRPLSNLFLIFNTAQNVVNPVTGERFNQKQGFFKFSYILQI